MAKQTEDKKTKGKKELAPKEYEQMGRQLDALYDAVHPDRRALYKAAFIKGVLSGVGGVIGATLVVALLLWLLSLFAELPLIGNFIETIQDTLETK